MMCRVETARSLSESAIAYLDTAQQRAVSQTRGSSQRAVPARITPKAASKLLATLPYFDML
jgi:hypothetical protein